MFISAVIFAAATSSGRDEIISLVSADILRLNIGLSGAWLGSVSASVFASSLSSQLISRSHGVTFEFFHLLSALYVRASPFSVCFVIRTFQFRY